MPDPSTMVSKALSCRIINVEQIPCVYLNFVFTIQDYLQYKRVWMLRNDFDPDSPCWHRSDKGKVLLFSKISLYGVVLSYVVSCFPHSLCFRFDEQLSDYA